MRENYEIPHITHVDDDQFPTDALEIVIEDEQDILLISTPQEEVDTSVIGIEEDRISIAGIEVMPVAIEVPPEDFVVIFEHTEDKMDDPSSLQGGVAETALLPDASERMVNEPSGNTGLVEVQPESTVQAGHLTDERKDGIDMSRTAVAESGARTAEVKPETLKVTSETEQRTDAVLTVIERVAQDFFDQQDAPFVHDRNGIFVPARADNVLTCLRAVDVRPGDVALDIGSGDGRWPIVAGGLLGLESYGYESSPTRHELALDTLQKLTDGNLLTAEEAGHVHLMNRNFFDADISNVDVFSFYQGSGPGWRYIEDKLLEEGKPGARLILYGDLLERETVLEFVQTVPIFPPTNIYRIPDLQEYIRSPRP